MFLPKSVKIFVSVFLSIQLSNIAPVVASEALITTDAAIVAESRKDHEQAVLAFVDRADVQKALVDRGVAPEEVTKRLASLSDSEMQELAKNIDQEKAGGILVEILIIVLIIFLIKRM